MHHSSNRRVHNFAREFTPCPNPWPVEDEYPGNEGQQRSNAAKQRASPSKCKPVVHLCGYEGENAAYIVLVCVPRRMLE